MQDGKTITMKDGRTIDPFKEGVVGPSRKGRLIILSGDTRPSVEISNYIKDNPIDLLIHEATYTDEFKAMAIERKHSTIGEACAIAKEGHVDKLILTHFSIRFLEDMQQFESEAKAQFDGVIIAHDNMVYEI
jgi:ribonuclease Z